ncbi:MAG: hypothetical protein JXB50_03715 [Spirochaetes bacterium]|nr:hypothetical protein [Spirochaetota bacterium]
MEEKNKKVKTIKNIILRGMIRRSEIIPRLRAAQINEYFADEIAEMVLEYKSGHKKNLSGYFLKKIFRFLNFILTLIFSSILAVFSAEFTVSKIISGSLLKSKLKGFLDNFLFWIGKKSVDLNLTDMMQIIFDLFKSTYKILISLIIGFIIGFILWKIIISVIFFVVKRIKLNMKINRLLSKYSEKINSEYQKIINV